MPKNIRCLVVDDSALSRKIVKSALERVPGVEVVATARDGQAAIERCREFEPDFVTMDLEMPRMNGIEAVRQLRNRWASTKIVMVSSLTSAGADSTTQALQAGAFDFVLKPVSSNVDESIQTLSQQLAEKVDVVRQQILHSPHAKRVAPKSSTVKPTSAPTSVAPKVTSTVRFSGSARAICIGISTGGPVALSKLIPSLPSGLGVPVFIVQHMPPVFTKSLADQLNRNSSLNVVEASDGDVPQPGTVYIAPGGRHLKIVSDVVRTTIRITDDPVEANARPSVDYMFRSAAKVYGNQLVAAVLTGMGDDGLNGCKEVKRLGGHIITQDAATCVVYGMPRCVAEAGLSDQVLPLDKIAPALQQFLPVGAASCH